MAKMNWTKTHYDSQSSRYGKADKEGAGKDNWGDEWIKKHEEWQKKITPLPKNRRKPVAT